MSNLIEDMFNENFNAQHYMRTNNIPLKDSLGPVLQAESDLIGRLDDETMELLEEYVEAWNVYHQEVSCDSFVTGFRLGAKLVMDVFAASDEDVPSLI